MSMDGFEKLYTTAEVAELLNVTARTVSTWCKDGLLPAAKVGRQHLISHSDLNEYVRNRYGVGPA